MSELFREIEQDMRAERIQTWWSKFGRSMVWLSVAVVLGTACGVLWKQYRHAEQASATSALWHGIQALAEGKHEDAVKRVAPLTASSSGAYYRLAMLYKARAEQESGDKTAAVKTYATLAAGSSKGGDQAFVDLANLEAQALSGSAISLSKDTPFAPTLMEWKAWQLVKDAKNDEAAKLFSELASSETTPASMRERAVLAAGYLGAPATAVEKRHE